MNRADFIKTVILAPVVIQEAIIPKESGIMGAVKKFNIPASEMQILKPVKLSLESLEKMLEAMRQIHEQADKILGIEKSKLIEQNEKLD